MQRGWQKIVLWLMFEIILNLLGIDDLADYSEFIFEQYHLIGNGYLTHIYNNVSG